MSDEKATDQLLGNEGLIFSESLTDYETMLAKRGRTSKVIKEMDKLLCVPAPLVELDKYTNGWRAGQLIAVGATAGGGKSSFALNSAMSAARAGKTVMLFSLESSREELFDRIVSTQTGISKSDLVSGELNENQRLVYEENRSELMKLNIVVESSPHASVAYVKERAIEQANTRPGLDFIVIDYLQLLESTDGDASSRISDLKELAHDLDVPVMVTVHLKSLNEERGKRLPTVDDVWGPQVIVQNSDIAIVLRQSGNQSDVLPPTYVILEKNVNGPDEKIIRCKFSFSKLVEDATAIVSVSDVLANC